MKWDTVIKGGRVVDGTGMPGFAADVAIRNGRIGTIGRVLDPAQRTIDADGLIVAPGFIDVHTHYDVQLDWDPLATPSTWHGVTTILAGNCGFTLAPAKPEDVDWLAGMLSRVEGMSRAALRAGLKFRGGSFGDYWKRFDGRLGVNVGSYVGHCAVRRYVMGDAASERTATSDEIIAMQAVVRQAMHEGAIGFSTSQLDVHVGEDGRGVPCNHAAPDEIVALCAVLAEFERGAIEFIPRSIAEGYSEGDRALIRDMYRASGRPVELNLLLPTPQNPMSWERTLEFAHDCFAQGIRVHPQFATNELGLHLKLADTFVFDEMPAWRHALTVPEPERSRRLRDPALRARMRAEFDDIMNRSVSFYWDVLAVEAVRDPAHQSWVGRSLIELAEAAGADPLDAFLDFSLQEDLQTQWHTRLNDVARAFIHQVVRAGVTDPVVMSGSSDGGAHLASFVGADYTTRLLTDWVPDPLTLEQAISRLTLMPATVHGLADRGVIREGAHADLVLLDRARLKCGTARLARDFPADTERYVIDAEGYAMVLVNGEVVMDGGRHAGALPGHVLRGG
ncbi:MAG TPA: amidohydrolase family protein [Candidatus Binatia bacterium]|nr:amidohydrolase family protein [Candidatus Binatia bacterium]